MTAIDTLQIVKLPHPALFQVCPYWDFDDSSSVHMAMTASAMIRLCEDSNGIGLAAPQAALNQRFFVMRSRPEDEHDHSYLTVVNPKVLIGVSLVTAREGCLSIPGFVGDVERMGTIDVEYQNAHGVPIQTSFNGLAARVFQHEKQHLDGKLFPMVAKKLYRVFV